MRRCLAILALGLSACTDPSSAPPGHGVVIGVVDGDTIDVRIGGRDERVRLIGIDTPETKKPNSPVECFGPEATAHTAALLPVGAAVRIERDVVARDDYGRLLGYVHRDSEHGGEFVNLEILRGGFAVPLTIEPNSTYRAEFVEATRRAQALGLGLWSACSTPPIGPVASPP